MWNPLDRAFRRLAARSLLEAITDARGGSNAHMARQFLASDQAAILFAGLDHDPDQRLAWLASLPELPESGERRQVRVRVRIRLPEDLLTQAEDRAATLGVDLRDLVQVFVQVWLADG